MPEDNAHRILDAEETFNVIKQRVKEDEYRDWVNLCWIVDDVGYDQLTVTAEQLKDVLDKTYSPQSIFRYMIQHAQLGEVLPENLAGTRYPAMWIRKHSVKKLSLPTTPLVFSLH